jgi:diguanylate cyclase (GGDEF)-like protein
VEELQLLETLADLISGALHGSLSFQIAQEQAITDAVTGLRNRRFFDDALSKEWKRATRARREFAVMLVDLDHFKNVNDSFGHLEGDAILRRTAVVLEANVPNSAVVSRHGGDEFMILIATDRCDAAIEIAETLRAKIAGDALLAKRGITASIGVASFPLQGKTPQALCESADSSMYKSKQGGGNRIHVGGT